MSGRLQAIRDRGLRALGAPLPRPAVDLSIGPLVSVGSVRIATAVLAMLVAVAVGAGGAFFLVATIGALLLVILPRPIWAPLLLVLLGVGLLATPAEPVRTAVVLAAGHLMVLLAALIGRMPRSGRVELRALSRPLIRFVIIQVLAQGIALVGYWLTTTGVTIAIVAVTVAVLLAVAAWVFSWRLRLVRNEPRAGDPAPDSDGEDRD